MIRELKEKLFISLCASFLLSFTLMFFMPLYVFFTNIKEFTFWFFDIWFYLILLSLICALIITFVLLFLKGSVFTKICSILFALGFLFWLQGNILVWNYGLLNGKEIPWSDYKLYGLVDSLVWLVVLAVAFVKYTYVQKLGKMLCGVLILVQIVSISLAAFHAPVKHSWKNASFNDSYKYVFSKNKNVIVLVLDTFQTDIFQELINENPDYKKDFEGFTYFRNAVGGFPSTFVSIPLILTGQYYDNSQPVGQYLKESFTSSSIPFILKNEGYRVDLFTDSRIVYTGKEIASNITTRAFKQNDLIHLYRVSLFRSVPHYFKKYFYVVKGISEGNEPYQGDLIFAQKIVSESTVSEDQAMFKFYHLWGTHPPFHFDETLEPKKMEFSRDGYKAQSKGALKIAEKMLETLRRQGIYDNTMVVIVGDHGSGASGSFGLNFAASGYEPENEKEALLTSVYTVASGLPLILIKPFKAQGELKISDAPVSISDVPKTVFSELGIDVACPGSSMFSVDLTENRSRRFMQYEWKNEYVEEDFLTPMDEYLVKGFSWRQESWVPTYRRLTKEGIMDTRPPQYSYGSSIIFGIEGNAAVFQGTGWAMPENGLTWTNDLSASLVIPVSTPTKDLKLKVYMYPLIGGEIKSQPVDVYINGNHLGGWDVSHNGEYTLSVPREIIKEQMIKIKFKIPKAVSPVSLKIGDDQRILGIAVKEIVIDEEAGTRSE